MFRFCCQCDGWRKSQVHREKRLLWGFLSGCSGGSGLAAQSVLQVWGQSEKLIHPLLLLSYAFIVECCQTQQPQFRPKTGPSALQVLYWMSNNYTNFYFLKEPLAKYVKQRPKKYKHLFYCIYFLDVRQICLFLLRLTVDEDPLSIASQAGPFKVQRLLLQLLHPRGGKSILSDSYHILFFLVNIQRFNVKYDC